MSYEKCWSYAISVILYLVAFISLVIIGILYVI